MTLDKMTGDKKPFHERVAEQLIEQLKQGTAPWQKPWVAGKTFLPFNPITQKRYKGINTIHLMMQGYHDPRWVTYKQAEAEGWQVRKGERATSVQYWKLSELQDRTDENGKPVLDNTGKPARVEVTLERPRVFFAAVFNASQIEGIPEIPSAIAHTWNPVDRAETILKHSGANIRHGESSAFYRPSTDTIHLPDKERFKSSDGYYATALHELGHWTGHTSRLNRDLKHLYGSEGYAKEELRAEIFSLILGEELRIGHDPAQHAAYVQHWIKIVQDDAFEIFRAAADAEKMQHYVLQLEHQQEKERNLSTQEETMTAAVETAYEEKTYIKVPFPEKDEAKALGARWDRQKQSWYIPERIDVLPFVKWHNNTAEVTAEKPAAAPEQSNRQAEQNNRLSEQTNRLSDQDNRQYLVVPFREKANARRAGALWDKVAKSWYAGPDADMAQLKSYLPKNNQQQQAPALPPNEEFADVLRSFGFEVAYPHPIMDGRKHRVQVTGDKKGEMAGFYVGHLDGHPAGYIKNNRTGQEMKWHSKGYHLSAEQKVSFREETAKKQQQRQLEQAQIEEKTAERCRLKIAGLQPIVHATPYLMAKEIPAANGIYTNAKGEETYVPVHDINGKIWSIQYIQEDGTKRFAKNSRKEGCFHVIGGIDSLEKISTIIIAEGYATAASISMVLRLPTVAAFDSGNLPHVAKVLREKFPDKPIVIAGDDDKHLEATQGFNPGRLKAEEAAKAVGGQCVFPRFGKMEVQDNLKGFTDFNDLAVKSISGRSGIRNQIGPILSKVSVLETTLAQGRY